MNGRLLLAILSFTSIIVVCAAPPLCAEEPNGAVAPQARWPSLGGDYSRSGLSAERGPAEGCVKWTFETGGAVLASPTVGADGRIHLACEDGTLYTLDADGSLLWSFDVNTPLLSAPSIGPGGRLYVGGRNGTLTAIDADGSRPWTYFTAGEIYSSPAVAANGDVFAGSADGTLHALANDGTEFRAAGPAGSPPGSVTRPESRPPARRRISKSPRSSPGESTRRRASGIRPGARIASVVRSSGGYRAKANRPCSSVRAQRPSATATPSTFRLRAMGAITRNGVASRSRETSTPAAGLPSANRTRPASRADRCKRMRAPFGAIRSIP